MLGALAGAVLGAVGTLLAVSALRSPDPDRAPADAVLPAAEPSARAAPGHVPAVTDDVDPAPTDVTTSAQREPRPRRARVPRAEQGASPDATGSPAVSRSRRHALTLAELATAIHPVSPPVGSNAPPSEQIQRLLQVRQGLSSGGGAPGWVRDLLDDAGVPDGERLVALQIVAQADFPSVEGRVERLLVGTTESERSMGVAALLATQHPRSTRLLSDHINRPELRSFAAQMSKSLAPRRGKNWSPQQLVGAPDLPVAGDLPTAWAAKRTEMGKVTIELVFASVGVPAEVRVRETLNPGAISRVDVADPDGDWHEVWSGEASVEDAPRWFAPPLAGVEFETHRVRLTVDTDRRKGWNEIDAVELVTVGGGRQWVQSASASSSYSD